MEEQQPRHRLQPREEGSRPGEEEERRPLEEEESRPLEEEGSRPGEEEGGPGDLAERRREAQGCLRALSQHSYWFDVWVFLLFDLVLFIFVYLLP
ncbi:hypothetical protein FKM82_001374 [Ascaphus truei]